MSTVLFDCAFDRVFDLHQMMVVCSKRFNALKITDDAQKNFTVK